MIQLEWDNSLSLGIEHIDSQHKSLFALFSRLSSAVQAAEADEDLIANIILELKEYALTHLTAEEHLMHASSYPGLKSHAEEHAILIKRLAALDSRLANGDKDTELETIVLLWDWLVNHVKCSDKRFAEFLERDSKVR